MDAKKVEMVAELRKMIGDEGFDEESMKMLAKIVADKSPEAIGALLLLNRYTDDDDRLDEMYTVIHTVEGFPRDVFIREVVGSIPELSASSPYLLDMLIRRMLNSTPKDVQLLNDFIRFSGPITKEGARDSLEQIIAATDAKHLNVIQHAKTIINNVA